MSEQTCLTCAHYFKPYDDLPFGGCNLKSGWSNQRRSEMGTFTDASDTMECNIESWKAKEKTDV